MKLLVLGGTRFLGRHTVEAALAREHRVTIFTRGKIASPWGDRVTHRVGDRDPQKSPGLDALATGEWDAAIDLSGYVPRCVRGAADMLATRVGHYAFVSSLSAYAEPTPPGRDETAPLAVLTDPASEEIMRDYGALKAACEREVGAAFGDARTALIRPGLIVGAFDPTDRFGYWVARFLAPHLLGERDERIVVPAPGARPVQFVDAHDVAALLIAVVEQRLTGPYNVCSERGQWTFDTLFDALTERARARDRSPRLHWADDATLAQAGIEPWTGLPLWIPDSDASAAGFMEFDCRRAHRAGLAHRALAATIDDTAQWLESRDNAPAWKNVLTVAQERTVLAQ